MERKFIKPSREGLIVRDPVSMQLLPETGAWKPCDGYWTRSLIAGDVVEATPPDEETATRDEAPARS